MMTDLEMIAALTRQLEVTTMFLQLDARKLREKGRADAAEPTEKQIAANQALIQRAQGHYYAQTVSLDSGER